MAKPNLTKFVKDTQALVDKHTPEILTGIGIAGMLTTTVLAVKATPKALQLMDERKFDLEVEKLPPIETIKATWKCYIPAAVTGTVSIGCLIGASSVNARRNAALATAYKLSQTALSEYREKVIETIGEKKDQAIRDKIDKERIEEKPVSKNEVIITEKGQTLCFDTISGRYFKSDIDRIKKAVNELNRKMVYDNYVSLNEFYDELDLGHTTVGDDLGWNMENGFIDIYFSSQIADDGTPCIVVNYDVAPKYDYYKFT